VAIGACVAAGAAVGATYGAAGADAGVVELLQASPIISVAVAIITNKTDLEYLLRNWLNNLTLLHEVKSSRK